MIDTQGLYDIVVRAIVLFTAIPVHESAHAWVADKLGDSTARNMGRLTLNPFAHLDLFGSLMMLMTGFGWAKPVPINGRNLKHIKRDMAITSIAGPISNILLALLFVVLLKIMILTMGMDLFLSGTASAMFHILLTMISINIGLAVFNLLPIPPLDGSRLLTALLPAKAYYKLLQYERVIMLGLFLLLFTGVLSLPLNVLSNYLLQGIDFITGFLGRIF